MALSENICSVSNWQINHHIHFVELRKIPTFTIFFTAYTLKMYIISLQNGSLSTLCKANRIASLYPVRSISFLDQTDLGTQWCKIECFFSGKCEYNGRLYSDSWDDNHSKTRLCVTYPQAPNTEDGEELTNQFQCSDYPALMGMDKLGSQCCMERSPTLVVIRNQTCDLPSESPNSNLYAILRSSSSYQCLP